MTIEAYPLCWPEGRPRQPRYRYERARFETTFARARDDVIRDTRLLIGKHTKSDLIISTNIPLRRDGLPLAGQKAPDDPGVAIYFTYRTRQMCFACDRWDKVEHNMQAIAKTIDALRGIMRWGTGDMMEAAFTGFAALPAPGSTSRTWRDVLGVSPSATTADIENAYKRLRSQHHPDKGGDAEAFNEVQRAYEQARLAVA